MKYRITATKSKYLLKHAMYELTYEKLKDDPNWSIEPFTYTFMHEEPTSDKVSLGWVTGMTAHICIQGRYSAFYRRATQTGRFSAAAQGNRGHFRRAFQFWIGRDRAR